ncbi:adenylate kinase [Erysipelothrix urinaevulpis]|uniref:adenylate kinase n=1 Tax=Erysipelothrix urinaevulpis TaxID=2683717 RepID=UPI00191556AA|nr:adenylate kinase [Erysipelothrix urinaevulpis]
MITLITGPSHAGKTYLAQKILEQEHRPYMSIDHLKMGLIRSAKTDLTVEDDMLLQGYLWEIVKEIIKTAIENEQELIVEGIYIPYTYRQDFNREQLNNIEFISIVFTDNYITQHFSQIVDNRNSIETRQTFDVTLESVLNDHHDHRASFKEEVGRLIVVEDDYIQTLDEYLKRREKDGKSKDKKRVIRTSKM